MSRARLNPAVLAAAVGAVDSAQFLATRRQMFREAPGRAAGTVAALALWATVGVRAAAEEQPSTATLALSAALAAGNAVVLAMHLRHRIANPRVFLSAAAGGIVLADVLRRR